MIRQFNKDNMEENEKYNEKGHFRDDEEAERTANAERIEELRKRCEEFLQVLAYDFGDIIVADTVDISETERNEVKWNIHKKTTYVYKPPFVDFRLCFTAYKKD